MLLHYTRHGDLGGVRARVLFPTYFVSHRSFISLGNVFPSAHVRQGPKGMPRLWTSSTNDRHPPRLRRSDRDHDGTTTKEDDAPGSDAPESESIRERIGADAIRRGCILTQ
jgi:hypothetical protein